MRSLLHFLLGLLFISQTLAANELPSYMTPCDFKEANFDACVREQIEKSLPLFTKGIPELHVNSIDPLNLDDIVIDGNGLKLTFTNTTLNGVANSKLTNLAITFGDAEESFKLEFKGNMSLIAQYEADGQILILPIKGKGDALINAQGIKVEIKSKLVHYNDSKGEHLKLILPNYKYDIESTTFDLKNLFNGNKQLADTTLQFANENWRQLMDDLAPPVIKQIVRAGVKVINKFFAKVTIDTMIKGYSRA